MACNVEFDGDMEADDDEELSDKSKSDPEYDIKVEVDKGEPEDIANDKLEQMFDDYERMADAASLNDVVLTSATPSTAANTTHQAVKNAKKGMCTGRGRSTSTGKERCPTRGLRVNEPMHLEFDHLLRPTGKWRFKYGQQLGLCIRKLNINWEWCTTVSEGLKNTLWQETHVILNQKLSPFVN